MTFIDSPQLRYLIITFFKQIDFDCPRLAQFTNRIRTLEKHDAHVRFHDGTASVGLSPGSGALEINISCIEPDWQLSSVAQVCNSSLPPLSTTEDLYIEHRYSQLV